MSQLKEVFKQAPRVIITIVLFIITICYLELQTGSIIYFGEDHKYLHGKVTLKIHMTLSYFKSYPTI